MLFKVIREGRRINILSDVGSCNPIQPVVFSCIRDAAMYIYAHMAIDRQCILWIAI